ncbi:hypothetical protein BIU97_10440 [Curtobacterium sp. MCBA15_009]|uniref:hypothetical protein n=1 Tax=Curtobacterium sp. MCBA15_009 TaxID=1898737 RepID=UPI0008DE9423|nr:hypothetical protein [Curtobacterium sp. MCBA15_009]OII10537.1 hypothetical protein BIU97_10440 [Curtobacterium sp. MCBA15_009]
MQWKFSSIYSVGPSSYGDRRGLEQFVTSARVALQVLTIVIKFNAYLRQKGRSGSLSVNEGKRTRVRQSYLWVNRFVLGVVVAEPFTSPHDEVKHGNAIDFGITEANGSNRALSPDEFTVLHNLVAAHGGIWTGVNFGEPWHHEMATAAERELPFFDARERLAGTPPPGKPKPTPTPPPAPAPAPTIEEDDMPQKVESNETGSRYLIWPLSLNTIRKTDKDADEKARAASQADGVPFVKMSSPRIKLLLAMLDERIDAANASDKAIVKRAVTEAIRAEGAK